jgi:DNA-directed RNA polymerase specialized sigma24 family protein
MSRLLAVGGLQSVVCFDNGTAAAMRALTTSSSRQYDAFMAFVHQYECTVYTFCYRMIGDPVAAEAVAQAVFADVYAHAPQARGLELLRATCHHCLNHLPVGLSNNGRANMTALAEDPLQRLLNRLPPQKRAVLLLHVSYGLRCDEMAAVLDMSAGSVRQQLYQACHDAAAIIAREQTISERGHTDWLLRRVEEPVNER